MSKSKAKPRTPRRKTKEPSADNSSGRRQTIAEAAYYKAQERGFAPGHEELDWLEAENEVDGEPREAD
jgi:hypothetical protein